MYMVWQKETGIVDHLRSVQGEFGTPFTSDKLLVRAGRCFCTDSWYWGAKEGPNSLGFSELSLLPLSGYPSAAAVGTRTKIQARLYWVLCKDQPGAVRPSPRAVLFLGSCGQGAQCCCSGGRDPEVGSVSEPHLHTNVSGLWVSWETAIAFNSQIHHKGWPEVTGPVYNQRPQREMNQWPAVAGEPWQDD